MRSTGDWQERKSPTGMLSTKRHMPGIPKGGAGKPEIGQ